MHALFFKKIIGNYTLNLPDEADVAIGQPFLVFLREE
jgi:hypothetical protein